jgi:hypothetical protein
MRATHTYLVQEMLQHELDRFQNRPSSDVRIDPDASPTGDSYNHSSFRGHELCHDDVSSRPLISRTSKRSRAAKRSKGQVSSQRGLHVRSSCADEIIASALGGGKNNNRLSQSPDRKQTVNRLRHTQSGLNTEALGPAPMHFDPSRDCADLLAEWGVCQPDTHAPKGTENASSHLNSIERMLDHSKAERDHMAHKEVCTDASISVGVDGVTMLMLWCNKTVNSLQVSLFMLISDFFVYLQSRCH